MKEWPLLQDFQEGEKEWVKWKMHLNSSLSVNKGLRNAEWRCVCDECLLHFQRSTCLLVILCRHVLTCGCTCLGSGSPSFDESSWCKYCHLSPLWPWADKTESGASFSGFDAPTLLKKNKKVKRIINIQKFYYIQQCFTSDLKSNALNSPTHKSCWTSNSKNVLPFRWLLSCIFIRLTMLGPHFLGIIFDEFDEIFLFHWF